MDSHLASLGITPTAHQREQLDLYMTLLRDWNQRMNLVAASTLPQLKIRHVTDSAQLVPHLPAAPARILDVGAGAGLPGLILAILAPQHRYTLAEKVGKKAAFLRAATVELGLTNVTVHAARAELLKPQRFDIITCRAWTALDNIIALTSPLLAKGGSWLLLKGEAYQTEIAACPSVAQMTMRTVPSITNPAGVVLHLTPRSTGNGYNS